MALEIESKILLGELAAQVAHDIGTPLLVLQRIFESGAEFDRKLIQEELERTQSLMNKMLRRYRGEVETELSSRFDLVGVLKTAIAEARALAKDRCEIIVRLPNQPAYVTGQKAELAAAISNIVKNAIEALDKLNARVEISLQENGKKFQLIIRDNGSGIAPEKINLVFNKDVSFKSSGTGLGLFQAKAAVESMAGSITLRSDLGVGSEAEITLPMTEAMLSSQNSPNADAPRLVLIDDTAANRLLWSIQAKLADIVIESFASGDDFFAKASGLDPSTPIYVDYFFESGGTGDLLAASIVKAGFSNVYIATEYQKELIACPKGVRGIVKKDFPIRSGS